MDENQKKNAMANTIGAVIGLAGGSAAAGAAASSTMNHSSDEPSPNDHYQRPKTSSDYIGEPGGEKELPK